MLKELKVNPDTCVHCGTCADVCYVDVIRWDEDLKIPYAAYPEDCKLCCICEAVCKQHAIECIPDFAGRYYPPVISTQKGVRYDS